MAWFGLRKDKRILLSIMTDGKILYTSPYLINKPKDFQEGRVIEIMFTFEGIKNPYFVYVLNEEYYDAISCNFFSSLSDAHNFEKMRTDNSNWALVEMIKILCNILGVSINSFPLPRTPCNFLHNKINTNTLIYVDSLKDWYPIRHTMSEEENAAVIKAGLVNSGHADIKDFISLYNLSPA